LTLSSTPDAASPVGSAPGDILMSFSARDDCLLSGLGDILISFSARDDCLLSGLGDILMSLSARDDSLLSGLGAILVSVSIRDDCLLSGLGDVLTSMPVREDCLLSGLGDILISVSDSLTLFSPRAEGFGFSSLAGENIFDSATRFSNDIVSITSSSLVDAACVISDGRGSDGVGISVDGHPFFSVCFLGEIMSLVSGFLSVLRVELGVVFSV
jgi:hypothetical protein